MNPKEQSTTDPTTKCTFNSFVDYIPSERLPDDDGKTFPKCERCNGNKDVARMFRIIPDRCWNCGKDIKLAFVEKDEVELILPDQFTAKERELAAQRGVILKKCRNCLESGGYANFCGNCNQPTDYFRITGLVGSRQVECNIVAGYDCDQCDSD